MSNKSPSAIFFDLDETLVENRIPIRDLFARMYFDFEQDLGAENQMLFFNVLRQRAANLWSSMFETDVPPEHQFVNCFRHCIAATGLIGKQRSNSLAQQMFDHFQQLSAHNVVFHDGAEQVLQALSNRGIITGIITNGIEQIQLGKIHHLNLHEKVDHVTVSAQARAHKPLPAVFSLALKRANVSAMQAWHVGDHVCNDVAGAIRSGMSGIFYSPEAKNVSDAPVTVSVIPHSYYVCKSKSLQKLPL